MSKNCKCSHHDRHICSKMSEDSAQGYTIERSHKYAFGDFESDVCWRFFYSYYDPDFGDLMETPRVRIDYCPFCGDKL